LQQYRLRRPRAFFNIGEQVGSAGKVIAASLSGALRSSHVEEDESCSMERCVMKCLTIEKQRSGVY
jgi:hypothetical protein